jgi:hypothetical protein
MPDDFKGRVFRKNLTGDYIGTGPARITYKLNFFAIFKKISSFRIWIIGTLNEEKSNIISHILVNNRRSNMRAILNSFFLS